MFKKINILIVLIFLAMTAFAADMNGTDENGNAVILKSDGTWSYVGNQPQECREYASKAVQQQKTNQAWQCGYTDVLWHDGYDRHYNWCIGAAKGIQVRQMNGRDSALKNCAAETRVIPEYLGCFVDNDDRDIQGSFVRTKTMTTEACVSECRTTGYKIAATQYGEQCFCGNSYGKYGRASDADCSVRCAGNDSQRCGGGWRNSVYRVAP